VHAVRHVEDRRSSARAMGEALRRLQIPIGQVLSSPTYRALETIKFAQLGPATTYAQLGDSGQRMVADKSGARGVAQSQNGGTPDAGEERDYRDAFTQYQRSLAARGHGAGGRRGIDSAPGRTRRRAHCHVREDRRMAASRRRSLRPFTAMCESKVLSYSRRQQSRCAM
jgi:hypothetical protein